jgi:hypothetical protein
VSSPRLEELVAEMVFERDWRHLDPATARAHDQAEGELAAEKAAAEARLLDVGRLHARGRSSTAEWLTARDELAEQVAELQQRLEAARRRAADAGMPAGGEALRAWWDADDTTLEQKRAAMRRVLVCVFVKPAIRRGLTTVDPDRVEPVWKA